MSVNMHKQNTKKDVAKGPGGPKEEDWSLLYPKSALDLRRTERPSETALNSRVSVEASASLLDLF